MISTLTPNPSLDLTYELAATLARGAVQRAAAVSVEAGGKGINVSRNLAANGIASRAVAPIGGPSGEQFLSLLEGVEVELVRVSIAVAVRINTALAETSGALTKINAGGPTLTEEEVERLLEVTAEAASGADWFAVCGSLPYGAPGDLLALAVEAAHQAGCKAAADGSGPPLAAALEAEPDLIKPNDEELAELVGRPLVTFGDVLDAAEEARSRGARNVLVSLGADGAILLGDGGVLHAMTPPFVPRSTVGAGDALLAGYLAAGGEGEAALVEAVAWGAAAASLPGSRGPRPEDLDRDAVQVQDAIDTSKRLKGAETE